MQDHVINHATNMHAWDKQLELWVKFGHHNNLQLNDVLRKFGQVVMCKCNEFVRYTRREVSLSNGASSSRGSLVELDLDFNQCASMVTCWFLFLKLYIILLTIESKDNYNNRFFLSYITNMHNFLHCVWFYMLYNMTLVYEYTWEIYMGLTFTKWYIHVINETCDLLVYMFSMNFMSIIAWFACT